MDSLYCGWQRMSQMHGEYLSRLDCFLKLKTQNKESSASLEKNHYSRSVVVLHNTRVL